MKEVKELQLGGSHMLKPNIDSEDVHRSRYLRGLHPPHQMQNHNTVPGRDVKVF